MLRPIHALRTNEPLSTAEREASEIVDETIKILILAGSLRRDSYNRALARAAEQLAPSDVSTETFDGLGAIPFYDGDVEDEGLPATVALLRRAIVDADALLIATPEYNGATSGVLKNALDWASRGPTRILAGKPVAVMGVSTGGSGARGGIESVVRILGRTRSDVIDHVVAVSFAARAFDDDLALADADIRSNVAELIRELVDRARGSAALAA
jgi:chromate reductase